LVSLAQPDGPSAFYDPPEELPAEPAGTVIRDETIDGAPAGQSATRVLYLSTNPSGDPIAVSGVVVTPTGTPPDGGWPVIAWAHGTSGVDRRCAPSMFDGGGLSRVPELDHLIAAGNVVVMTDYPGLGTPAPHPYLVAESEGRAVLDSIRAVRDMLGDTRVADAAVIYGHSQGGHAAVAADSIAASYAPELDIVGVAAMAPPSDLGELLDDDKSETAGIVLTGLAISAWTQWFPDLSMDDIVEPPARPVVRDLGTKCIVTDGEELTILPDVAALEVSFLSTNPTAVPSWKAHLDENSLGAVDHDIPLLVAQGLTDTIVRPDVTKAYVEAQCADGATIEFQGYPDTGHFEVRTAAAPSVRDWMLTRLHGDPVTPGCTDTTGPTVTE
jgi:pimeloyl-ACP methyl ester carboxylesterase